MSYDRLDKEKTNVPHEPTVRCEECLKEVPRSEAHSSEGADYTRYFCGLSCFGKWQAQDSGNSRGDKG